MAPDLLRNQILQSLDRVPDTLLLRVSEFLENLNAEAQGDFEEASNHFVDTENDPDGQLELVNGFLIVKSAKVPSNLSDLENAVQIARTERIEKLMQW